MKSIFELLAAILQLLIYVVIFALQVLAPLMTLIFLIVTFINPNNVTMTIFYVSAISYFVGYLTSSLGMKSVVPIYEKSLLNRRHPVVSTILNMIIMFVPSFFIALIICLIFSDFTYYLHNAIMVNWLYRLIKFFMKNKKVQNINQYIPDNDFFPVEGQRDDLQVETDYEEDEDFDLEEFFENRKIDLVFTAETMASTYNILRDKKKLPISSAMFGTAILSEKRWIEADITNIPEVMLDIVDAKQGKCMVGEYEKIHSPEMDFNDYENFLVNLAMSVACVNININKPQIEGSKIVDYIIDNKKLFDKHVKEALKGNYTIDSMWITMNEINIDNGYPTYEELIKKAMRK